MSQEQSAVPSEKLPEVEASKSTPQKDVAAFVADAEDARDHTPQELIRVDSCKYLDRSFHAGCHCYKVPPKKLVTLKCSVAGFDYGSTLHEFFTHIDEDNSGKIQVAELQRALSSFGLPSSEKQTRVWMKVPLCNSATWITPLSLRRFPADST